MLISHQIDADIKAMRDYFSRLFRLLDETENNEALFPSEGYDLDARKSTATFHKFSHFIKPDMVINLYSLVEYWIREICQKQSKMRNIAIPKKQHYQSELLNYHNFLLKSGIAKNRAETPYKKLDDLRFIRNKFVHNGGHIQDNEKIKIQEINSVTLHHSLILISNEFIWDALENADLYLTEASSIE